MSFPDPWGAYIAGHSNNTPTSLYDFTGNKRDAIISGCSFSSGSGNGATASIPFISGGTTNTITWPLGSLPPTYTLCSITRVIGATTSRVFDGKVNNILHGHLANKSGVAHYGTWVTPNITSSIYAPNLNNWLVMCGTNSSSNGIPNNVYVNGNATGIQNGLIQSNDTLTINNGGYKSEASSFAFSAVFIWDTGLTSTQLSQMSTILLKYLSTGAITYPWIYPCFKQGAKILRFNPDTFDEYYVPVETLRRGDLIKTARSGYKPVYAIGHKTIPLPKSDSNSSNRLYKFSKDVFQPLYITGEHCTLWESVDDSKRAIITEAMGDVYITEEFYRMPARFDDRAEPYDGEDKPTTIWHFALENDNEYYNYGVWANGLLVESCSIEHLVERSNMQLLE